MQRMILGTLAVLATVASGFAQGVPASCTQLIVSTADSWQSNTGRLQRFERSGPGAEWKPVSPSMRVLFGKNGIAWGRGVAGQNEEGASKREGDNKAPAGIFELGKVFTDESSLPPGANYPFVTVTPADAWIEDPSHPQYNQHVRIPDPSNPPAWFRKAQMRQNDYAHRWKIEIKHNTDPTVPGAGSAIFFHIQRGPDRHSAGCTTMPRENLLQIISWLREGANPHYVLLPVAEYQKRQSPWGLPEIPTSQ